MALARWSAPETIDGGWPAGVGYGFVAGDNRMMIVTSGMGGVCGRLVGIGRCDGRLKRKAG